MMNKTSCYHCGARHSAREAELIGRLVDEDLGRNHPVVKELDAMYKEKSTNVELPCDLCGRECK